MQEPINAMEELRQQLDDIEESQEKIQRGRERLAHYEEGTMSLAQAVTVIAATLEGQRTANEVYGNELDEQCRDLEDSVRTAHGELACLQEEIETRRRKEDTCAEGLVSRMEEMEASTECEPTSSKNAEDGTDESGDEESPEPEPENKGNGGTIPND